MPETLRTNLKDALKNNFGFDSFKGRQEEIITSLLEGNDTVVIMPTGGGKSLCYQLPALVSEGTALVISPLIALMKNQVDLIRGYASDDTIAHFFNSSLNKSEKIQVLSDVESGKTKMLYIAPETLTKEETLEFFKSITVSFVAVDEAHCISEWGHDFRPEYRNIRDMIEIIGDNIPIIALTATATPKVQSDILKTLKLEEPSIFIDSFNREKLYYEIRPKKNDEATLKNIVGFIRNKPNKSGIIYTINRKSTEKIAEMLNVNGISAKPYHAGLDGKIRTTTQDDFLMERINVVVATIAFGMGIDKPDIRFVIHYDLPKSLENYYQETGRAGRDGLGGDCICYYNYKDVTKLEHLFKDKPVAERERNMQLIDETLAFIESSVCRRKFILHYFGEQYEEENCGYCDNCKNPKEKIEVKKELKIILEGIRDTRENFDIQYLMKFFKGVKSNEIMEYGHEKLPQYGAFKGQDDQFTQGIIRQALIAGYIWKDIEQYGVIMLKDKGREFIENPTSFSFTKNHDYKADSETVVSAGSGGEAVLDEVLLKILKDLRKKVANEHNLPPYVIFQDASLEDMALLYPISIEEFANIQGVSKGKAMRYGQKFSEAIKKYVQENEIERPDDFVMRTMANKSSDKIKIIQAIDKKLPLKDLAKSLNLNRQELLDEIETIVNSGTKLNISYAVEEALDEDLAEEIYDYFKESETDDLSTALEEFEGEDIDLEEIQIVRIKFMSENAN
ncbi:MAG: DNA helicase RecQ [Chitinophagales bacterium]|nr:DNA helicase RecQ [Chitinophagales bacterium]